jgi:hypothetical protein
VASDGPLKFPDWQEPLQELILEFDGARLPEKVQRVEALISERLKQLTLSSDGHVEREAIQDALNILRIIKREKRAVPDQK